MERTRRKEKEENIKTKHLDIYFASSVFLTLAPGTGGKGVRDAAVVGTSSGYPVLSNRPAQPILTAVVTALSL